MDPYLVDTIFAAKRAKGWAKLAQVISGSRRKYSNVNLGRIEKDSSDEKTVIVPGKVLGSGNLSNGKRICAIYFSMSAINKIKKSKGEAVNLIDEIKKNPSAEGVRIIR